MKGLCGVRLALLGLLVVSCGKTAPPSPPGINQAPPQFLTCDLGVLPPAVVGTPITFRALRAPEPRQHDYTWEFDDGEKSAGPHPVHTYAKPGRYYVTLGVKSRLTSEETGCRAIQVVHRPLPAQRPVSCGAMALSPGKVWVTNPDADTVAAIDTRKLEKAGEWPVGENPRGLALAPDGSLWVVNQDSSDIHVLDATTGARLARIELPPRVQPFCVAFSPDGARALVTLQATGKLLELDPSARVLTGRSLAFPGAPQVRGLAITGDSRRALVTRFVSPDDRGEVYDVALDTWSFRTIALGFARPSTTDVGASGFPNYLSQVVINPDGTEAWLPSKQDNMRRGLARDERGRFVRDGKPLANDQIMRPVVSRLDLVAGEEVLEHRVDTDDAALPYSAVVSPLGDVLFVSLMGSNTVDVMDTYSRRIFSALQTFYAPQAMALLEGRLFVQNYLSRTVRVFEVAGMLDGSDPDGESVKEISTVAKEPLSPQLLKGKQLFFNSSDPRMSGSKYISCASCHLDGGHDGRVWDFTDRGEGLRNTKTLLGVGGPTHGRLHWSGNFDELQDFEHDMRRRAFLGRGFLTPEQFEKTKDPFGTRKAGLNADLDALAAFVASLQKAPPSPHKNPDGTLTEAGNRGRAVFAKARCGRCHNPAAGFTDSPLTAEGRLYDVGTLKATSGKRMEAPLTGLDTPSLIGVWASAPYLHDGSARTLKDVFKAKRASFTRGLSRAELDDLVEYLRQLD